MSKRTSHPRTGGGSRHRRPDSYLHDDDPLRGHKPTVETRKRVEAMAAYNLPHRLIAISIGISPPTLRKYYEQELEFGADKANARVAETVFQRAIDKNHPQGAQSAAFWLKTRAGWKETVVVDQTVKQQGPDLSGFSDEQLDAIAATSPRGKGSPNGNGQLH